MSVCVFVRQSNTINKCHLLPFDKETKKVVFGEADPFIFSLQVDLADCGDFIQKKYPFRGDNFFNTLT